MKKIIKYFVRDALRKLLGVRGYTILRFVITHHYLPSFINPNSFSEKIIYRKFNSQPEDFSKLVDKHTVRDYVSRKIGEQYLIPQFLVKNEISKSDFSNLPSEFVIKSSNGGGGENVELIEDKNRVDLARLSERFNSFLKINYGKSIDERFYDIEEPKVIVEKLIRHKDGKYPSDYKFHVFNRSPGPEVIIQVDEDRFGDHRRSLFDINGRRHDYTIQPKYGKVKCDFKWPDNFNTMISLAIKLAEDFKYVRVDLYNVDGVIYFGELTFCHGSGWERFSSKDADFLLGSYWEEYN